MYLLKCPKEHGIIENNFSKYISLNHQPMISHQPDKFVINKILLTRMKLCCAFLIVTNLLPFVLEYLSFSKSLRHRKYRFSFIILRSLPIVALQHELMKRMK
jgi:hypothetical protein